MIERDFEDKAPHGHRHPRSRSRWAATTSRYELLRDLALNLFWVNRYAMTMYEKRPMRWRDVPRRRDDVFLPVLKPWEDGERKVAAVEAAYKTLPPDLGRQAEDRIFRIAVRRLPPQPRTTRPSCPRSSRRWPRSSRRPTALTFCLAAYDPDYPGYGCDDDPRLPRGVPELEALHRRAMVLHNQYPWDRADAADDGRRARRRRLRGRLRPAQRATCIDFIRRVNGGETPRGRGQPRRDEARSRRARRTRRSTCASASRCMPRIEALAVVKGEHACTNDDLVRNARLQLVADDGRRRSRDKTGIEQRRYTERGLDDISLQAAEAALAKAGRAPEEIGAVIFCSCTSARLMPSVATWLSGQLGIFQTHSSFDIVAACAGLPYGLSEAMRLLQEVERPVLLVCAEKFSDKIGTVRTSRMIFGDGAAAIVVGPAAAGRSRATSTCSRPTPAARERGQLDHLAQPGVRQRHHGVRARGQARSPGATSRR